MHNSLITKRGKPKKYKGWRKISKVFKVRTEHILMVEYSNSICVIFTAKRWKLGVIALNCSNGRHHGNHNKSSSKVENCCEIHGDYDKDMQVNPSKLWKFEAFVETLNSESGNTESWNTASRCWHILLHKKFKTKMAKMIFIPVFKMSVLKIQGSLNFLRRQMSSRALHIFTC